MASDTRDIVRRAKVVLQHYEKCYPHDYTLRAVVNGIQSGTNDDRVKDRLKVCHDKASNNGYLSAVDAVDAVLAAVGGDMDSIQACIVSIEQREAEIAEQERLEKLAAEEERIAAEESAAEEKARAAEDESETESESSTDIETASETEDGITV